MLFGLWSSRYSGLNIVDKRYRTNSCCNYWLLSGIEMSIKLELAAGTQGSREFHGHL